MAVAVRALGCLLLLHAGPAHAHRPHDIVTSVDTSPDGRVAFVFMRSMLFRSRDGGQSWSTAQAGMTLQDTTSLAGDAKALRIPVPHQYVAAAGINPRTPEPSVAFS